MSSFPYSCKDYHSNCPQIWLQKFIVMSKYTLKMYGTLHLVTTLIFKRKDLKEKFRSTMIKVLIKIVKSASFMTGFIVILRMSQCLLPRLTNTYNIYYSVIQAVLSSFAVLFESSDRVVDYTVFSLPRTLDSLCDLFIKLGYLPSIKKFPQILLALTVGLAVYLDSDNSLKPNIKTGLDFLIN